MKSGDLVGGKYRLEKLLGEGAMGAVWAARNERTDRAFAVKFMLSQYAKDPTLVQRFLNEARVCGRLDHPSLVEIYDLGIAEEFGGAPFLVMELLRGEGLDQLFLRVGKMEPRKFVPLMLEVSNALELAHNAGIVHRDIKPANIFLHRDRKGQVVPKILDFGVSKTTHEDENLALTRAGMILGSPLYMSPEQARGQTDIDPRADVWAMGVIIYQGLLGTVPFNEHNYNAVLSAILTQKHRALREVDKTIPALLSDTVDICLAKDRSRRLPSAGKLAEKLEEVMLHYAQMEMPPKSSQRPKTKPPPMPPMKKGSGPVITQQQFPTADSEATEVMDRESLREVLAQGGWNAAQAAKNAPSGPQRGGAAAKQQNAQPTPSIATDDDEDDPSSRTAVLRRVWLNELASVVQTTKTDDIKDNSIPERTTERSLRIARVTEIRTAMEQELETSPPPPAVPPVFLEPPPNPDATERVSSPPENFDPPPPRALPTPSGRSSKPELSGKDANDRISRPSLAGDSSRHSTPSALVDHGEHGITPLSPDAMVPASSVVGKQRLPMLVVLVVVGLVIGVFVALMVFR